MPGALAFSSARKPVSRAVVLADPFLVAEQQHLPLPFSSSAMRSAASSPPLVLSVATNETISFESRAESMTIARDPRALGLFHRAHERGLVERRDDDARDVLADEALDDLRTCCSRSSCAQRPLPHDRDGRARRGSASRSAFTAPAWMAFQNSCVVPLGMTPMEWAVGFARPEHATASATSPAAAIALVTGSSRIRPRARRGPPLAVGRRTRS